MSQHSFPFAVRLIGFSSQELELFDAAFETDQGKGYGYSRLAEDNLKDPDLYVVNADDLKSLVILSDLHPSSVRPVMLIGDSGVDLPYPCIAKPIHWPSFYAAIDELVEKRADALSRLDALDIVTVSERRRADRVDVDLTDPSEYPKMRKRMPDDVGVLVVDKSPAIHSYLAERLMHYNMPVAWVNSEERAVTTCKQRSMAVVMINTSTPEVDPYRLCKAIKRASSLEQVVVILLVGKPFVYDQEKARDAGADGYLMKPLASVQLLSALKKFLPPLWRQKTAKH
jgi:CheY-like chemotaxis protein